MPLPTGAYISAMARFYPFKTEIDGRTYRGEWTICQGYRVCVRSLSGFGSEIADIGQLTPQAAAARTLEKLVRAEHKRQADWKAHQAREMERLARPRRTRKPTPMQEPEAPDDLDAIETLRALVQQIQGSDYRDKHGQPLEMNVAYRDALALLKLHGVA